MNRKESPTPNPSPNTRENDDRKEEANRRVTEYPGGVMETSLASDSQREVVPGSGNVFQTRVEAQLQLLKSAIEESNESVIIMTAQLDPPGPQIVYGNPASAYMTRYALEARIQKIARAVR